MKNSTAFAAAGLISLFAWDAAFAQSPSQIPVGAGANVTRQPAGSRFRNPDQSSASCRRARSRRGADGLLLDRLLCRRRLRRLLRLDLYRVRHDRLGVAEPEPRGCDGRRLRRLQLSGEPEFRRSAWKATFKAIPARLIFITRLSTSRRASSRIGLRRSMVVSGSPMTAPCSMRLAAPPPPRAV